MKKNVIEYQRYKSGEVKMPAHLKPRKGLKTQIFKNSFLEKLTRTPLWVPQVMYSILIIVFIYFAVTYFGFGLDHIFIFGISGTFTWTFLEYMIHRFVYHTETNSGFINRIQYNGHGVHHHHPLDSYRLAMPPIPGLILSCIFLSIFYLIMGNYAVIFMPGVWLGYLLYISLHYAQHVLPTPKFKPWKQLWQSHQIHHGINPYCAFGVSTRLWDAVFRTLPKKEDFASF